MSWICPLSAPRFSQGVNGFFLGPRPTPPPSLIPLTDKQMNMLKISLATLKMLIDTGQKLKQ